MRFLRGRGARIDSHGDVRPRGELSRAANAIGEPCAQISRACTPPPPPSMR